MSDYREVQVVGMHFRGPEAKDYAANLEAGAVLYLEREDDNQYDVNAIKVMAPGVNGAPMWHLGYINKDNAAWISPDLDDGVEFDVTVEEVRFAQNNHYPYVTLTEKLEAA